MKKRSKSEMLLVKMLVISVLAVGFISMADTVNNKGKLIGKYLAQKCSSK